MIDIQSFFEEKKQVPNWFKNHLIFKNVKQTDKIFPSIGLPNFSIETNIDNSSYFAQIITKLCNDICYQLTNAFYYIEDRCYYEWTKKKEKEKYAPFNKLINQFRNQLKKSKQFIDQFAESKGLYLQDNIIDSNNKIFAKKGESLFKVYAKFAITLRTGCNYNYLVSLDTLPSFKEYSTHNVNGKMKIIFSSDGNEGAWDILTMSQRGITSCQSWNGAYGKCIIGSVLDPYTAIMYLTSGSKTEYGTKMVRRCVVRYVINAANKRPCLFMEYMYPDNNPETMKLFTDALKTRIGDKFPIITERHTSNNYYVPYSTITTELVKHSDALSVNKAGSHNQYGILPYRDSFMEYKLKEEVKAKNLTSEQILAEINKYIRKIGTALKKNTSLNDVHVELIKNTVLHKLTEKIDTINCSTISQLQRKVCMDYVANKSILTASLVKQLNEARKKNALFITTPVAAKSKPKKANKNNSKITAKKKIVKPDTAQTVKNTVNAMVLPTVSKIFKTSLANIVVAQEKNKLNRAKVKLV